MASPHIIVSFLRRLFCGGGASTASTPRVSEQKNVNLLPQNQAPDDDSGTPSSHSDNNHMLVLTRADVAQRNLSSFADLRHIDAHLRVLDLKKCWCCTSLTGDVSALRDCVSLEVLDMKWCAWLTGDLSALDRCRLLTKLQLWRCDKITGDLSSMKDRNNLTILNLSSCSQVTGSMSSLEHCTSLQILNLNWCEKVVGDIGALRNHTHLTHIALGFGPRLEGDISVFSRCDDLAHVKLCDLDSIVGDIAAFQRCTKLTELSFHHNRSKVKGDIASLKPFLAGIVV